MTKKHIEISRYIELNGKSLYSLISELQQIADEIGSDAEYFSWDDETEIRFRKYREETDEEYQARIKEDERRKIREAFREQREYKRLKKKFGQ